MMNTVTNKKRGDFYYRDTYICKRMRLLGHLREKGFLPIETIVNPNQPEYNWWIFTTTPELMDTLDAYFAERKAEEIANGTWRE